MTFDIFLKSNGLEESFQATVETVSFENRNGKKFTYLISDIERCLKTIWESKERLIELLEKDWTYNEDKFRSALGEIFSNEEWNSVVSNLGSQTPNTVRCLELYAFFKLQKEPTKQLSKPEILYWKNLDPIYTVLDLRARFEDWLRSEKELRPKSVSHYSTAITGVLSRAAGRPLFEVNALQEVLDVKDKILNDEYIISLNENGKGMYAAALNNFILFLERDQIIPGPKKIIPFKEISAGFKNALTECGFITSKNQNGPRTIS